MTDDASPTIVRARSIAGDDAAAALRGLRRQRARAAGRRRSPCAARTSAGCATSLTAPGDLGLARAYVAGDLERRRASTPATRTSAQGARQRALQLRRRRRPSWSTIVAGARARAPAAAAAAAAGDAAALAPRRRRACGTRTTPRRRGDPPPLRRLERFYEMVLGPSMAYTCAVFPTPDASLEEAQDEKFDLVARKLGLQPGHAAARRRLRLGRHGPARRQALRRHARSASRCRSEQATWAQEAIEREGLDRPGRGPAPRLPRRHRRGYDAISSIGLTEHIGVRNYPAYFGFLRDKLRDGGRLLNHCITRPHNEHHGDRARSSTATSSPTASSPAPAGSSRDAQDVGLRGAARGEPARALRADAARLVREPRRATGTPASPRSARPRPGSGASTWPGRGSASSATRSSCTRCSRSSPTTPGHADYPLRPTFAEDATYPA